jgi:hypothetical protein
MSLVGSADTFPDSKALFYQYSFNSFEWTLCLNEPIENKLFYGYDFSTKNVLFPSFLTPCLTTNYFKGSGPGF